MTERPVPEWIGTKPETPLPPRVKLRIVLRQHGRCDGCGRKFDPKLKPEFDHRPALVNGGQNRESMIVAVCHECHSARTKEDVAEKSKVYALQAKHLGIRKSSRPFPKRRDPWGKEWRAKTQ